MGTEEDFSAESSSMPDSPALGESWAYRSISSGDGGSGWGGRFFEMLLSPQGTAAAGAVTMGAVLVVASSALSSKKIQPPPPDPAALQLQETRQQLKATLWQIAEERFRADYGDIPQNSGILQKLVFAQAAELKFRVSREIGDPKSKNYRVPEAQLYTNLSAEAARRMAQAASGSVRFQLVATDSDTGKKQLLEIGPQELAILAVAKDTAAQLAQHAPVLPSVRLLEVAEDVTAQIAERKAASENLQEALGQDASYSASRDVYGRRLEDMTPASLNWQPEPLDAKRGKK